MYQKLKILYYKYSKTAVIIGIYYNMGIRAQKSDVDAPHCNNCAIHNIKKLKDDLSKKIFQNSY